MYKFAPQINILFFEKNYTSSTTKETIKKNVINLI
jgi:diphthamide biosynthesis methyltransferase